MSAWPLRRRIAVFAAAYFVLVGIGQVTSLVARARLNSALEHRERAMIPAQASLGESTSACSTSGPTCSSTCSPAGLKLQRPMTAGERSSACWLRPCVACSFDSRPLVDQLDALGQSIEAWHGQVAGRRRRPQAAAVDGVSPVIVGACATSRPNWAF